MSISRSKRTYYTKEEYEAAKRNDNALLYAQRQGYDLVRTGRYFYMRQHDSLVFAPSGCWFWKSCECPCWYFFQEETRCQEKIGQISIHFP